MSVPESCPGNPLASYINLGTIQVSQTGSYRVADGGQQTVFVAGLPDLVIHVYKTSFVASFPNSFRELSTDVGAYVDLEAGEDYILVIQTRCGAGLGPYAVVLGGPGDITGAGFTSAQFTYGQLTDSSPEIFYPVDTQPWKYWASQPVRVRRSGYYRSAVTRAGFQFGAGVAVYEGEFDPENPRQNQVKGRADSTMLLVEGTDYVFAVFNEDNIDWQFVMFPPGPASFNADFKGAWVSPGINSQGVLLEIGEQTGVLFLAWFTFPYGEPGGELFLRTSATGHQSFKAEEDIGATDQRWLTAFGALSKGMDVVNISFENTSRGTFNGLGVPPQTDSSYGTGSMEVRDCDHLVLNFDLPGDVSGSNDLHRATRESSYLSCLSELKSGIITEKDFIASW